MTMSFRQRKKSLKEIVDLNHGNGRSRKRAVEGRNLKQPHLSIRRNQGLRLKNPDSNRDYEEKTYRFGGGRGSIVLIHTNSRQVVFEGRSRERPTEWNVGQRPYLHADNNQSAAMTKRGKRCARTQVLTSAKRCTAYSPVLLWTTPQGELHPLVGYRRSRSHDGSSENKNLCNRAERRAIVRREDRMQKSTFRARTVQPAGWTLHTGRVMDKPHWNRGRRKKEH